MAKSMIKGEKIKLEDLRTGNRFEVGLSCRLGGAAPDISCFGVDNNGKLSDDRYFIFYNQRSSPEGAIVAKGSGESHDETFTVDLDKLPKSIVRLVFVVTLESGSTFAQLSSGTFELLSSGGSTASYQFTGADFSNEKAVIIAEIYLKTVWRLSAVGQGFNGGLSALLKHFGGEEISPASPAPTPSAPPPVPPSAPPEAKVRLSKVRLEKQGATHKVSLAKGAGSQVFHINLQWDEPSGGTKQGGSLFGKIFGGGGSADLDLGCMWRDRHGNKGVVQPLGGNFGSKSVTPYIFLDKDDRTGAAADGENMYIYRPDEMQLVMIFAMIYQGAANFSQVNARLIISDGRGGEIVIPLNAPDPKSAFCAVATIANDGQAIQFQKEERYFSNHKDCDEYYGFGFNWVKGKK